MASKNKSKRNLINYLIWHPRFKELLTAQATGTSGSMLNISKAKFESAEAIYPPLKFQERFKSIYWKVQKMNMELDEGLSDCTKSFESLSQNAFQGKL